MAKRPILQHIRSTVAGKKPSSSAITFGEIAVNYLEGQEFLSIKNTKEVLDESSTENIAIFSSDEVLKTNIIPPIISGNTDQVIDEETKNSPNPVSTKAVVDYVSGHTPTINVDQVIDETTSASTNAVATKAVVDYVSGHTPTINVDQVIDETTSASTNAVATKAVVDYVYSKDVIDERDLVISESLNDLEETKADKEDVTSAITSYTYDKATIDRKVASGGTFDPEQYYDKTYINNILGTGITSSSSVTTAVNSINQNLSSNYYTTSGVDTAIADYTYNKATIDQKVSGYTPGDGIDISSNVISVTGRVKTSSVVSSITSASTDSQIPSAKAVSDYTYDKATIDQKVVSGGTFDPTQYYTKAEIDSNERVVSKALNDLNTYRNFYIGSNVINTLTSIPTTKRLIIANGITSSSNTLTVGGALEEGTELYIIVQGTAGIEITLDSNMINTSGDSIVINNNGYCEISIISVNNGNTYYVRGV